MIQFHHFRESGQQPDPAEQRPFSYEDADREAGAIREYAEDRAGNDDRERPNSEDYAEGDVQVDFYKAQGPEAGVEYVDFLLNKAELKEAVSDLETYDEIRRAYTEVLVGIWPQIKRLKTFSVEKEDFDNLVGDLQEIACDDFWGLYQGPHLSDGLQNLIESMINNNIGFIARSDIKKGR
jgi:hypothetical protein